MPSLPDIVAQAKASLNLSSATSSVRGSIRNSIRSTAHEIAGIPAGMIRNAENSAINGVTGAINNGLTDVRQAAGLAFHGDFTGALEKLSSGPQDVMSSLSSSFGLSKGSTLKVGKNDPTNSLAGALARADPLMSYDWYCVLPDVAPIGGSPVSLPWYFVEEATPSFRAFEQKSQYVQGRNRHFPGSYFIDSLRLALYADSDNKAMTYLQAWQGAMVKPTTSKQAYTSGGGYGRPSDYWKPIQIILLNPAKQQLILLEYIECWPVTIDAYTLDSGTSGRIMNHVTFAVGDVFMTLYSTAKAGPTFGQSLAQNLTQGIISGASNIASGIGSALFG